MQAVQDEAPILSAMEIKLLVEIGYLAAGYRHPVAYRIFTALRTLRPDLSAPLIGLAMYCIESGKASVAVETLERAIINGLEDRLDLKAILGMALFAAQRNLEAERLLSQLVSTSKSSPGASELPEIRMAKELLERHASSFALRGGIVVQGASGIATELN